ncbi:MAG: radical SAM protein [Planctomycetes bacterium]|nr:radical SAM protein [Planctomycetota bacterium]
MKSVTSETPYALEHFTPWIRANDDHSDHHLELIEQTDTLIQSGRRDARARQLAEKLERWRYQHLHEHAALLSPQDEALVDALDQAANHLAGRPARPPRRTHRALSDGSWDTDSIREATEMADERFPLASLVDRAAELTNANFRAPSPDRPDAPTRRRMLLYAPLYVSSQCVNYCTYCGFRYPLEIERRHLSRQEAAEQTRVLRRRGFEHLLIVGGDFPRLTTTDYYRGIIQDMADQGIVPAIEIAPQSTESYAALVAAGVRGVTLYQETYDENRYGEYHRRGPKSSYHWRLESHERAAEAGIARLGLGVLLGLADPVQDVRAMMRHGAYLMDRFPGRTLAFSLPRIHEAPEGFDIAFPISDQRLLRLYCLLRVAFPRAELVLSTREQAELRNRLAEICITQMSAGSSTAPGGYDSQTHSSGEQFPVSDHRTPDEVARWLDQAGFRVVWSV